MLSEDIVSLIMKREGCEEWPSLLLLGLGALEPSCDVRDLSWTEASHEGVRVERKSLGSVGHQADPRHRLADLGFMIQLHIFIA